jgi:hypothetical protein
MSHFEILLPFGLPAPQIAPDLLRELRLPALSTLLARAKSPLCRDFDPFSRSLPHEAWLSTYLGHAGLHADTSPALATAHMKALGFPAEPGIWFILQPVHIHTARDHLVLTDSRRTTLSDAEARALFETALPLFQQAGKTLRYGNANTWFVRADDWHGLQTATPDAACGHNVDIWMPKGEGERAWRKLQNEVQMEWHEHAVNLARAEQRLQPVNSLWLWGAADARQIARETAFAYSGIPIAAGGTAATGETISSLTAKLPHPRLLVLDDLSDAALAEDWAVWLERMHALEQAWFAPLLAALRARQLTQVTLIIGHHAQLREFTVKKSALLKFWAKPSLARLLP